MRDDLSQLPREEILERFKPGIERGVKDGLDYVREVFLKHGLDLEGNEFGQIQPHPADVLKKIVRKNMEDSCFSFNTFGPRGSWSHSGNSEFIVQLCAHYGVDTRAFFVAESQSHNRPNNYARWLKGDYKYDKKEKPDKIGTAKGEDFDKFMKDVSGKLREALLSNEDD